MSAEPSLHHTDVASDAPSGSGAAEKASGNGPEPSQRNRRNRRGRRRRGRRPGRTADNAKADEAPTAEKAAGEGAPKPSDVAARNRHGNPPAAGGNKNSPASMPRTKRRGGRRTAEAEPQPKLRTVRETSAGGLVLADLDAPFDDMTAALIGRVDRRGRTMWSLPKGHIETGETAEQTAMREVAEETGISGTVVAPLGKIDYWFVSEGRRIHKTVHHYLLRFTGGELSDDDYEVSEVAWVPLSELPRKLTYSDERRLARMAESVIADLRSDPSRLAQSEASCIRTEPNDYEKAAAARNERRNEPPPPVKARRRRRRPRRPANGDS
ncbi:MutT/NUDIX family protein [Gordonia spumicola]|uniref:MutT/NUDIX family protein n=1 Tax=Gordonia spumicola TaxID=589161 RepID=A0A7I9V615_9ACTN|nr:NUDIX hydrolase [Gordonia spumicola]GEE00654.1 MutT/NUDIX family protein [Gordonia spumicola]